MTSVKPFSVASAHRELQQAELQQRPGAGEEVEPRAGHLRAALHVDQAQRLPEFEVILRVLDGPRFADGVEHHEVVLAAGRDAVDDHVRDRHVRCGESLFGLGLLRLGGLDLLGEFLGLLQQGRPLVGRCLADLLAGGLLLGAQVVGGRHRGPPRGVGFEERVDEARVFAAGALRCAHHVRVFAQQLEVDHGRNPTFDRATSTASAPLRHNLVTLQLHHLSQRLTRLSQWSGCWRHPNASISCSPTRTNSRRSGWRGGRVCRPRRRAARCC